MAPVPLRRLPLENSKGPELAASLDDLLDRIHTQGADQLVLEILDANEESQRLHIGPCQIGAEAGTLQTTPEVTLLADVAQTSQPDAEP